MKNNNLPIVIKL